MMTSLPLFQNIYILKRPKVTNFANIIKITTMFIETTFKDWKIVKRIGKYVLKYDYTWISCYNRNCAIPVKKSWCQQT